MHNTQTISVSYIKNTKHPHLKESIRTSKTSSISKITKHHMCFYKLSEKEMTKNNLICKDTINNKIYNINKEAKYLL